MRAVYLPEEIFSNEVELKDQVAHHLINVLRIKAGNCILGLSGSGIIYNLKVLGFTKKSVQLAIESKQVLEKESSFDIAIGKVKKEALDSILKQSCELSINKIIIASTEYSQRYPLNLNRIDKILISGIEQSNNSFLPAYEEQDLRKIEFSTYNNIVYFSSIAGDGPTIEFKKGSTLIVIGPEGGHSKEEELFLESLPNSSKIKLKTSIMRSPTAMSCAVGFCLGAMG